MATRKINSKKSKKNNSNLFGAACILLGLLVILIMFLVNKDRILTNFKDTAFFERVFGKTPEFVQNHESKSSKGSETVVLKEKEVTIQIQEGKEEPVITIKTPEEPVAVEKSEAKENDKKEVNENIEKEVPKQNKEPEKKKEEPKAVAKPVMSDLQLCFVMIDSDGSVVRKLVKRSVSKSDSPLTTALGLLLKGPDTTKSAEKDCITLIPEGTKLLSAKVQNGVATLNFNENFEFNTFGAEGYRGQLMQIVYTATAFSTVNSVQFMIEGEKREYLSEAQWIGSPLSRNSF